MKWRFLPEVPEKWDREHHKKRIEYFLLMSKAREGGGEVKKYSEDLPEVKEYIQGGKLQWKTATKKRRHHITKYVFLEKHFRFPLTRMTFLNCPRVIFF